MSTFHPLTMEEALKALKASPKSPDPGMIRFVVQSHILGEFGLEGEAREGVARNLEICDWLKLSGQLASFVNGRDLELRRMHFAPGYAPGDLRGHAILTELIELASQAAGRLGSQPK